MEHADREKHSKTNTKLITKLYNYKGDLTKNQTIIETLHKEKDTLTRKLEEAQSKANELATKQKEFQDFLEKTFSIQNMLDDEVSTLKEDLVETFLYLL